MQQAVILVNSEAFNGNAGLLLSKTGNKPYIQILCEQLGNQGFSEVILISDLNDQSITNWIDSLQAHLKIKLSVFTSQSGLDPLSQLKDHQAVFAQQFLLHLAFNFCSFRYDKIRDFHRNHDKTICLLVGQGSSADLKSSPAIMAVTKNSFFKIAKNCQSFSGCIENLNTLDELAELEYTDRIYNLNSTDNFVALSKFLSPQKVILLDRDGTLNSKLPKHTYLTKAENFFILDRAKAGIRMLSEYGFSFAIISNQAGVASGEVKIEELEKINQKLYEDFQILNANLLGIYNCTAHSNDHEHPDRKPNPGMFHKLSSDLQLRLDDKFYIGDDPRDMQAAWNANCMGAYVGDPSELQTLSSFQYPVLIGRDLAEIAEQIIIKMTQY